MRDSQGGGESYPADGAEGVGMCCMKDSPSVLSCIGKRTREGCDRGLDFLNDITPYDNECVKVSAGTFVIQCSWIQSRNDGQPIDSS